MEKSAANEVLAALYLRLNGYFTTGLILHSPEWGQNRTDIDCLAVRHPYHSQADRDLEKNDFLDDHEDVTDLILCEVKSIRTNCISTSRSERTLTLFVRYFSGQGFSAESRWNPSYAVCSRSCTKM